MSGQSSVLHGQIVIFLLVHLLIHHILLRHPQRATCPFFVNLRRPSSGFDPSLQAPVTSPRSGNVGTVIDLMPVDPHSNSAHLPLLVLFMSSFGLDDLGWRNRTLRRHVGAGSHKGSDLPLAGRENQRAETPLCMLSSSQQRWLMTFRQCERDAGGIQNHFRSREWGGSRVLFAMAE